MSLLGAEAIADTTIAYIQAKAAAKLTDVAARPWSVALTLEPFKAIRLSEPDRESEQDFPVLYVMPDSTDIEPMKGNAALDGNYRFEFAVLAYDSGRSDRSSAETAKRLAMRYILAVFEMLQEMHDRSDPTYHVAGEPLDWGTGGIAPRFIYGLTYASSDGEYLADARLVIGVQQLETL
jgi:hypothetical protein